MAMTKKFWLLFLSFALQVYCLKAEPVSIHIEDRKDYEILDQFLRMEICEEGYDYVLERAKPITIRDFYSLDHFPVSKDPEYSEREFIRGLLVREAIPIWKRLCSHQKNFVLKAVPLKEPGLVAPGIEVQFINVVKLREVVEKNIDLLRYVLGPAIQPENLVNKIAYSEERLVDILHNNSVLIGIVLGFGSYNSLIGGRTDTIFSLTLSKDCAPFSPKSFLMQSKKDHSLSFLTPERYGSYYLEFAGGDDSLFRDPFSTLLPSSGFLNMEDEMMALDAMDDPLPSTLMERPAFVFGAYRGGPSNQPLFECLQQVQKQTKALLNKSDFLERVLEKIGGKKPRITCDKSAFSGTLCSLFHSNTNAQKWVDILRGAAKCFEDKEGQSAFIEAFRQPTASSRKAPMMVGASKAVFEGLKKALLNLTAANSHFEMLSKDNSLRAIVAKQLYFKTTLAGSGKELKDIDRVRMGYVIEDPEGNVLFANHDIWLNLSQTISGFAHGVQGMHVGEKRTLFIHPALAYGALTTLPPCIELIIKVHLLDVDEATSEPLPSLTPCDLNWIQDPLFYRYVEESIHQLPRFVGSFYRDLLDKIEGLDKTAVIAELDKKASLTRN